MLRGRGVAPGVQRLAQPLRDVASAGTYTTHAAHAAALRALGR